MNKKIILLVAVLLIVAVVFVACKGKGDVDEPTTDSPTEPTSGNSIIIDDKSDELDSGILPGVIVDGDMSGDDVINIGGQEGNNNDNNSNSGEDSIEWNVIIGN